MNEDLRRAAEPVLSAAADLNSIEAGYAAGLLIDAAGPTAPVLDAFLSALDWDDCTRFAEDLVRALRRRNPNAF